MCTNPQTYAEFTDQFARWATEQSDIRAARVIGSRTHMDDPSIWIDLDIQFFTSRSVYYRTHTNWLEQITRPWLIGYDDRGEHVAHWSVPFREWTLFTSLEHGLAVDFMIVPLLSLKWHRYRAQFGKGATRVSSESILVDKDGYLSRWGAPSHGATSRVLKKPTETEFLWVVNEFWGIVDRSVRYLGRGKGFEGRRLANESLQKHLTQMIQWYSGVQHNWQFATGWRPKDIELWADPEIVTSLGSCYSAYELLDVKRAIIISMDLFQEVAPVVAESLHFSYHSDGFDRIYAWVQAQFQQIV